MAGLIESMYQFFFPVAPRRIELKKEGQNMPTSLMESACAVQQLFISQHSLYPHIITADSGNNSYIM